MTRYCMCGRIDSVAMGNSLVGERFHRVEGSVQVGVPIAMPIAVDKMSAACFMPKTGKCEGGKEWGDPGKK